MKCKQTASEIFIVLPQAPSLNAKFVSRQFRLSKEYSGFKKLSNQFLSLQKLKPIPLIGGKNAKGNKVKKLKRNVYMKLDIMDKNMARDIDACEKVVQDVLEGYAYENDWQIKQKLTTIDIDEDNPRVEITLWSVD